MWNGTKDNSDSYCHLVISCRRWHLCVQTWPYLYFPWITSWAAPCWLCCPHFTPTSTFTHATYLAFLHQGALVFWISQNRATFFFRPKCKRNTLAKWLCIKTDSEWVNFTLDSNTLNSLLPLALQNSLHLSLGETPAYFGIHCFIFPL